MAAQTLSERPCLPGLIFRIDMKSDRKLALYKMKTAFNYWGMSTEFWQEVKDILREMEKRIMKRT